MPLFYALLFLLTLTSCAPALPPAPHDDCGAEEAPTDEDPGFVLRPEPDANLDAVPPIVRLRIITEAAPEAFVLVSGEVGSAHLGQLARDDVSAALEERIVDTLRRRDGDLVVLAPRGRLPPGPYAVASGAPKGSVSFEVVDDGRGLSFVFPPGGHYGASLFGVWCGDEDIDGTLLPPPPLLPTLRTPRAGRGLADGVATEKCIHLTAPAADADELSPLGVDTAEQTWWLDPLALSPGAATPDPAPPCRDEAIAVGPGCIEVADDRLYLQPRDPVHLWSVRTDGIPLGAPLAPPVWVTPETLFTRRGLAPGEAVALDVTWIDAGGTAHSEMRSVTTAAAQPHLVITEVMANPIGPEPQQEWVEIYNDGTAPADLSRYRLADPGGGELMPSVLLPPGRFALVVSEGYDAVSYYDPNPAPDTIIVVVTELARNGLANGGEPLALERDDGRVVSRFPPLPKPRAGQSVERADVDVDPADPGGFHRLEEPTPGR